MEKKIKKEKDMFSFFKRGGFLEIPGERSEPYVTHYKNWNLNRVICGDCFLLFDSENPDSVFLKPRNFPDMSEREDIDAIRTEVNIESRVRSIFDLVAIIELST